MQSCKGCTNFIVFLWMYFSKTKFNSITMESANIIYTAVITWKCFHLNTKFYHRKALHDAFKNRRIKMYQDGITAIRKACFTKSIASMTRAQVLPDGCRQDPSILPCEPETARHTSCIGLIPHFTWLYVVCSRHGTEHLISCPNMSHFSAHFDDLEPLSCNPLEGKFDQIETRWLWW